MDRSIYKFNNQTKPWGSQRNFCKTIISAVCRLISKLADKIITKNGRQKLILKKRWPCKTTLYRYEVKGNTRLSANQRYAIVLFYSVCHLRFHVLKIIRLTMDNINLREKYFYSRDPNQSEKQQKFRGL
jgi:hypothetical protein